MASGPRSSLDRGGTPSPVPGSVHRGRGSPILCLKDTPSPATIGWGYSPHLARKRCGYAHPPPPPTTTDYDYDAGVMPLAATV